MAWTTIHYILAVLMVATGTLNTISTNFADKIESEGRNGTVKKFNHPFFQATGMFLGESSCLVVFYLILIYYKKIKKVTTEELPEIASGEKFNKFIFIIPALCDLSATTLMYIGLTMTFVSSFQMLRGAIIIFTGIFSVLFLKRKLKFYEWLGIFVIIIGLITIGLSDVFSSDISEFGIHKIILGDIIIILAQIISAIQMIVEEKFLRGKKIAPLQAVGYEGFFGFLIALLLLVPLYYIKIKGSDGIYSPIEDPYDAFLQIKNNWKTSLAVLGNVVSIAFFNFAGISVTKKLSATTRTVLDSVRTFFVWLFSLIIRWKTFQTLNLVGFIILLIGIFIYNDVFFRKWLINKGYIKLNNEEQEETSNIENQS